MTTKIFPKVPWCTTPCHIRSTAQALMLRMKQMRGSSTDQERLPIQSPKNSSGTKVISMYKIMDDTTAQAAKSVAVPAQRGWSWSQKGTMAARSSSSQFSCSVYRSMVKKRALTTPIISQDPCVLSRKLVTSTTPLPNNCRSSMISDWAVVFISSSNSFCKALAAWRSGTSR